MYALPPQPPPAKVGFPTWAIVLIVVFGAFLVVLPVVSVLAVYGVRKYLANAKTAEARASLRQIAIDAKQAYERDHALCPSASTSVPLTMAMVTASKYRSVSSDWQIDARRQAGFACLGFALEEPQYFRYSYLRTSPTAFEAVAHGDLNGDGKVSTFTVTGTVSGGTVEIGKLEEQDPEE